MIATSSALVILRSDRTPRNLSLERLDSRRSEDGSGASHETQTLRGRPRRCQCGGDAADGVEKDLRAERLLEHGDVGVLEKRPRRGVGGVPGDEDEARPERGLFGDGLAIELVPGT